MLIKKNLNIYIVKLIYESYIYNIVCIYVYVRDIGI